MLQTIAEFVIESGLEVAGRGVLKLVTLNGYRDPRHENQLLEIPVGLVTFAATSFVVHRFW